jgi:hypothetical protein
MKRSLKKDLPVPEYPKRYRLMPYVCNSTVSTKEVNNHVIPGLLMI